MTPQEFKAWFDGFTEAVDKAPTQKQWARIKERVAEIDGKAVTERVYVDRYLYPTYIGTPTYYSSLCGINTSGAVSSYATGTISNNTGAGALATSFDSLSAMCALGKSDAATLA